MLNVGRNLGIWSVAYQLVLLALLALSTLLTLL